MAPVTQWKRLDGVILGVTAPGSAPFRSGDVKYTFVAAYLIGGQGTINVETPTLPVRPYPTDEELEQTAQPGDPCTVTIAPDGTLKLFVDTEVWAVEDCT